MGGVLVLGALKVFAARKKALQRMEAEEAREDARLAAARAAALEPRVDPPEAHES